MAMNVVALRGRLTKDVELRYTQSGKAVASSSIAVERDFKNGSGERESDFINFVLWGKSAENFSNMVSKGNRVGINGRLQTRNYENNQGQKVYVTEVIANGFDLIETRAETGNHQNNNQQKSKTPVDSGNQVDISDADLPF